MRTDDHNNPAAVTTDICKQAGLAEGRDYAVGAPFTDKGRTFYTAKLLGDPVGLTIKVIDALGYYTKLGYARWSYIAMPKFAWDTLTHDEKRDVVGFHYEKEGGVAMRKLFPNYGKH